MHRKVTKFLSLFLSAAMIMGSVNLPVLAAEQEPAAYAETAEEAVEEETEAQAEEEEAADPEEEAAETEEAAEEEPETVEEAAEEDEEEAVEETAEEETDAESEEDEAEAADDSEEEAAQAADESEEEAEPAEEEPAELEEPAVETPAEEEDEAGSSADDIQDVVSDETAEEAVETEAAMDEEEDPDVSGEVVYVVVNIPYSDFYRAIGQEAPFDAVTSATTKKPAYYWDSSNKGNAPVAYGSGSTLNGVQLPVKMTRGELEILRGKETGSADAYYAYEGETTEEPVVYAEATVAEDGTVAISAVTSSKTETVSGAAAEVDSESKKHGDYLLEISGDGGILSEADKNTFQVFGAVMSDDAGNSYVLYHHLSMYYKDFNQIAFNTTGDTTGKGQDAWANYKSYYSGLEGRTITGITFYTNAGVYTFDSLNAKIATPAYVLMNIPYAKFYEAEGTSDVDAVSSSTKSKTRNNLAAGSYHVNADGSDISGVIYPVFIEDISVLEGKTQITDESSVDITVTNRGTETTTTYTGKDALFEAPDYAYYVLSEEPSRYKELTVEDGTFSFGAVSGEVETVDGVTGDVTYNGRHTDIEIPLEGTTGINQEATVSAVVLTDADGNKYGMRHVYNIWRATELGWDDDELDLYGKTITNIRYITQDAVIDFPVQISLKNKITGATASFKNATSVALGGLPADIENAKATVSSVVGRGETSVVIAEDAVIENGYVTTEAAVPGTTYKVTVASDNYADAAMQATYDTKGYVLMNIPYAEFYAEEGISGVDAVSTATVKTYNQTMAGGSYHAGYEAADPIGGAQILGVVYPVYVEDLAALEGMTQVTDADSATITVASGKSSTTTKDVTGRDLLFASGNYAYYILGEEPANYKDLSGSAGSYSFSAVKNGAQSAELGSAKLSYGGHYTDLQLDVTADEIDADAVVTGVVLTADGTDYALRHVENIWRKTSLGWNWTDLDGAGLSGKTITAITYYMQDGGIYKYAADVAVKKQLSGAEAAFTAANTITVTGLPEDIENAKATVSSVVGRGETAVVIAEDADIVDGVITTTDPAVSGTKYNVKIISDNYADVTAQAAFEELKLISIASLNYFYTDITGDLDNTLYQGVVSGRGGSTTYDFAKSDLTQVGETGYAYVTAPNVTPLSGTLYGYGDGTATNYKEVYAEKGASTDTDPAYDAVTSATGYTGRHAADIPKLVTYGTTEGGDKAITGLLLNREVKTVDAVTYVEANILNAEEQELTEEQQEAFDTTLKANPMAAPSETEIAVALGSASLTSSRYGKAEFAIVPDDTVEGYVWSEYWSNVYAATISDGTTTVGAVHWIDMYGESATSGPHYNKVEIALNNGTSVASNEAEVSRYAAFFDGDYIKSGTYTITVYADGYTPLTAEVKAGVTLSDKTVDYTGTEVGIDEAVLEGLEGDIVYTYYEDEACTKALTSIPVDPGTYYVKAVAADLVQSEAAKLTINPIAVTKIALNKTTADVAATKTLQLKVTFTPSNATDQTITWTSSDTSIATVDKNGLVKAKKYGTATITAKSSNGKTAKCKVNVLFADVANSGKSYFTPVYWAVDKGITVVSVNFRPEDSVTRGEFVAFLWRLAGKPKSTAKVNLKDVNSKTKFYDAIRWAVGKGIIKGYSDGTFKPDNNVTRGETATMIWRYAGKKTPKTKKSPFSDIKASTSDSYKAILWGAENGIIKGSGGKFLKNDGCTRGQVVTFLYRLSNK